MESSRVNTNFRRRASAPARIRWQADGRSFPHAQPANASRPRGYRKARRARFWAGPVRPLGVQAARRGRAGLRLVLRREGRHLACRRQPDDANFLRQPAGAAAFPVDGRSSISRGRLGTDWFCSSATCPTMAGWVSRRCRRAGSFSRGRSIRSVCSIANSSKAPSKACRARCGGQGSPAFS